MFLLVSVLLCLLLNPWSGFSLQYKHVMCSFSSSHHHHHHHPTVAVAPSSFFLLLFAFMINFPALSSVLCSWLKLLLLRTSVNLLWLHCRINESRSLCCLWDCCSHPKTYNICCHTNPILLPWKCLGSCVCYIREERWSLVSKICELLGHLELFLVMCIILSHSSGASTKM